MLGGRGRAIVRTVVAAAEVIVAAPALLAAASVLIDSTGVLTHSRTVELRPAAWRAACCHRCSCLIIVDALLLHHLLCFAVPLSLRRHRAYICALSYSRTSYAPSVGNQCRSKKSSAVCDGASRRCCAAVAAVARCCCVDQLIGTQCETV